MSTAAATPKSSGPFTAAAVTVMLLVGMAATLAFLGMSAVAPDLRNANDGGAHALSRSAVGFAGIARLLRETGAPVLVNRGEPRRTNNQGLLVLTPTFGTKLQDIRAFNHGGPILLVLPKWQVFPDPRRPGWVLRGGLASPEPLLRTLKLDPGAKIGQVQGTRPLVLGGDAVFGPGTRLDFGPVESEQALTGGDAEPALADQAGRPVLARAQVKDLDLYLLSDPDLLNNRGLASLQTASSAVALLDKLRADGPVTFDVTLNGFQRSRNLLKTLLTPPFLAATLCGLAAALLMGLHAAVRFGPVRASGRAIALGKHALVDNSAALIRLAKRQPRMGARYAALTRAQAARAMGVQRDLPPEALDTVLDRRTPTGQPPFTALAAEARAAKTDAELMQSSERLYRWRLEMTRERR